MTLFAKRVRHTMAAGFTGGYLNYHMRKSDLERMRSLTIHIVDVTLGFIKNELQDQGLGGQGQQLAVGIVDAVVNIFDRMPSAHQLLNEKEKVLLRAPPMPFTTTKADKQGAATFSSVQIITVILQECSEVRKACRAESDVWKTGELYEVYPDVVNDVTQARQFRSRHDIVGKATPAQAKHLRIALHKWSDEFTTVDGLGPKAKNNKYGVLLACLLNLPLRMRHYVDFILMLALWRAKYAKNNGGINRIVTGCSLLVCP